MAPVLLRGRGRGISGNACGRCAAVARARAYVRKLLRESGLLFGTPAQPVAAGGEHTLSNGLLLRSDLHTLFDLGYLTVDPKEKRIVVSDRIKAEFENGREYYKLRGEKLASPENPFAIPSIDHLNYHAQHVYRP